jgi:ABC-type antimicrobial peptide transport system permease subunit
MYLPIEQEPFAAMTMVLRTAGDEPSSLMPAARRAVASIDPLLPLARVQTMEQVVAQSVTQPRLLSALTMLFGALAGLLASVGVYGVMAYNVRRERREFGIRLALGADPGRVRRLVVARAIVLGALGVGLGAAAALLLTRTLQALLTDVQPTDPAVFAVAGSGLLAVTVLAGYLPALQASRTDPMIVLRTD